MVAPRPWSSFRWSLPMALTIGALGSAWAGDAAADSDVRDPIAARTLFQEAREAAAAGDHVTACPKFEESYRLDPAVGTLLNIAACDERQGRLATAWTRFQQALEQLSPDDDRRPQVAALVAELEPRLPRLTLRFPPDGDVTVIRDGVPVGRTSDGVGFPADPGPHVVVVAAPGRVARRYEVELAEGERAELRCEPGELAAAPARREGAPAARAVEPASPAAVAAETGGVRHGTRTAALVLGGVGVAGLVAGGVLRALAWSEQGTIDERCDADLHCDAEGMDAVERARTRQLVSTVSLAAGGAALGVGLYLGLARPGEGSPRRATLTPTLAPGGAGITWKRSF